MFELSDENYNLLCLEMNRIILMGAEEIAKGIFNGNSNTLVTYPENGFLTNDEVLELQKLKGNKLFESAIKKVLANSNAYVLFDLMNLIDQTTDPCIGEWKDYGITLIDINKENQDLINTQTYNTLHDGLYEKYGECEKIIKDLNLVIEV